MRALTITAIFLIAFAVIGCGRKSMPDKSKFTGRWHYDRLKATVVLQDDGRAEMVWSNETYNAKWYLPDDKHLVLRVVIPLHRPDIDDEINATEMYYTLHEVTPDKITAEQYDEEGIHTFTKVKDLP